MKKIILVALLLISSLYASLSSTGQAAVNGTIDKENSVNGVFVQYGSGAFDWIYINIDGSYAAKLDGMNASNGQLIWTWIYGIGENKINGLSFNSDLTTVTFGSATSSAGSLAVVSSVAGKTFDTSGLFLQYSTGAYDWVYTAIDGSYSAKLEGMNSSTNQFIWTWLNLGSTKNFECIGISTDKTSISFGSTSDFCNSSSNVESPPTTPSITNVDQTPTTN
jgi:hypothetical protein